MVAVAEGISRGIGAQIISDGSGAPDPRADAIERMFKKTAYSIAVQQAEFHLPYRDMSPEHRKRDLENEKPKNSREGSKDAKEQGILLGHSNSKTRTPASQISRISACFEVGFSLPTPAQPAPSEVVYVIFEFLNDDSLIIAFCGHDSEMLVSNWRTQLTTDGKKAPEADKENAPGPDKASPMAAARHAKVSFERIRNFILFHVGRLMDERKALRGQVHMSVATDYELDRTKPPPEWLPDIGSDFEISDEERSPRQAATAPTTYETPLEKLSEKDKLKLALAEVGLPSDQFGNLGDVLAHVFDAADEEAEGTLRHMDLLKLLEATLVSKYVGLTSWDVKMILATAHEDGSGLIDYIPFVNSITGTLDEMKKRRSLYRERFPERQVEENIPDYLNPTKMLESVELLQGEELNETSRVIIELCAQQDESANGGGGFQSMGSMDLDAPQTGRGPQYVRRSVFFQALQSKPERISKQECMIIMQLVEEMVEEDDEGDHSRGAGGSTVAPVYARYDNIRDVFLNVRISKLLNPLLESDIRIVRKEIVSMIRQEQLDEVCPIWAWKTVLMRLSRLLLSRFQIHILMCLIPCTDQGMVDVSQALVITCTMIERYFNPETYYESAVQMQLEIEADAKRKELEELQEMSGQKRAKSKGEEEEEIDLGLRDNKEEIEKNLVSLFTTQDESKTGKISAFTMIKQILTDWEMGFTQGGLTAAEKRGFIGEVVIEPGEDSLVKYAEHVKTWVPLLFEFRKNLFFKGLLEVDDAFVPGVGIPLVDLTSFEQELPVFSPFRFGSKMKASQSSKRRLSAMGGIGSLSSKERGTPGPRKGSQPSKESVVGSTSSKRIVPSGSRMMSSKTAGRSQVMRGAVVGRGSTSKEPAPKPGHELLPGESRGERRRRLGQDSWNKERSRPEF